MYVLHVRVFAFQSAFFYFFIFTFTKSNSSLELMQVMVSICVNAPPLEELSEGWALTGLLLDCNSIGRIVSLQVVTCPNASFTDLAEIVSRIDPVKNTSVNGGFCLKIACIKTCQNGPFALLQIISVFSVKASRVVKMQHLFFSILFVLVHTFACLF